MSNAAARAPSYLSGLRRAGPLCAFLGVQLPSEPFPRTNSTAEFRARMGR
ncbi:sulfotransferase [Mesorhizobium sp.]